MTNMPTDMAKEFDLIRYEIYTLHAKWGQFVSLYGKKANVEILNAVAPGFFRLVQDTFVDDVILSIGRLLDPPKSVGKDDLSLDHLVQHIDGASYPSLRISVEQALFSIRGKASQLKVIRNKLLAHNSLIEKQVGSASLYSNVSRNVIEEVINEISALLNLIEGVYDNAETGYEFARDFPGGSEVLIERLKRIGELPSRKRGSRNLTMAT